MASKVETSLDKTHRIGFVCHVVSHPEETREIYCGFIFSFGEGAYVYVKMINIIHKFWSDMGKT